MSGKTPVVSRHENQRSSFMSYVIGYVASLYLTVTAYLFVKHRSFSKWPLVFAISGLALAQLVVQLVFFLHLSQESRPRWRLKAFGFMVMVVVILVVGSIWIMANLDYHHPSTSPDQVNEYLQDQDSL